jgi:hypothetical protein
MQQIAAGAIGGTQQRRILVEHVRDRIDLEPLDGLEDRALRRSAHKIRHMVLAIQHDPPLR